MLERFKNYYQFRPEPQEEIIFQLRKHWIVLGLNFFKVLVSLSLLLILIIILHPWRIFNSWLWLAAFTIWFLVTLVYGFYEWMVWYLDLYILTTKRIIDIEQKTLFVRQVSEATLDKIQDVTFEINGFLATLLNFGDVKIETAGKEIVITLEKVAQPEKIQKIIFETQKDYLKEPK